MFACPECSRALIRQTDRLGVYWRCEGCGGRAMGLGLLRRAIGPQQVATLWSQVLSRPMEERRPCPACAQDMVGIFFDVKKWRLRLDVCRRCEFVWFDRGEYEAIPPPVVKPKLRELGDIDEGKLPPEAREKLALLRVEEMREKAEQEAPVGDDWRLVPALFGFPVETSEDGWSRFPWGTALIGLLMTGATLWFSYATADRGRYELIPAMAWREHGLTLLTSFFLHAGVLHLVGNLYFLGVFGGRVEERIGWWRWLLLLVLSTLVAEVAHCFFDPRPSVGVIGASGGISGLLAFYALKFPEARVAILFRLSVYFQWLRLSSRAAFCLWLAFQALLACLQSWGYGNVSAVAHLGGVAAGIAFWLVCRRFEEPGEIGNMRRIAEPN